MAADQLITVPSVSLLDTFVTNTEPAVSDLVRLWADGDAPAGDQLFTLVYEEMRAVVRRQRRRWRGDDTLDTTALVHEVYLRLADAPSLSVRDRAHFYAVAARATRQILSNYARRGRAEKRGGDAHRLPLEVLDVLPRAAGDEQENRLDRLWELDEALQQLEALHPRPCRVVECRFFAGLSVGDTAAALSISEATVKRDWALAQAWLRRALDDGATAPRSGTS